MIGGEYPIVQWSFGPTTCGPLRRDGWCGTDGWRGCIQLSSILSLENRSRRSVQHCFWTQLLKFFLNSASGGFSGKLGRPKLTRRKIEGGKTYAISNCGHR